MIKLPKTLIVITFFILLVIAVFHLFLIYETLNSIEVFNNIGAFFLAILISSTFLTLYQKRINAKNDFGIMTSPILTFSILFVGIIVLSLFFLKLIDFGFQTQNNQIIYYQISTIILSLLSLGWLIKIHVSLIKNKQIKKTET